MKRRYYLKIKLELQSVTCPGVWLCSTGYVDVTIKCLGRFFKSTPMPPKFPILCHDSFSMQGYFKSATNLVELGKLLYKENIEITLWQNSRRLAYYNGKLGEILYLSLQKCSSNKKSIKLLMTTTRAFPGIIAPKIQLSASATIYDNTTNRQIHNHKNVFDFDVITPSNLAPLSIFSNSKGYHSCLDAQVNEFKRQKTVCHATKDCSNDSPSKLLCDRCSHHEHFIKKSKSLDYLNGNSYAYCNDSSLSSVKSSNSSIPSCQYFHLQRNSQLNCSREGSKNTRSYHTLLNYLSSKLDVELDDHIHECKICNMYYRMFYVNGNKNHMLYL